MTANFAIKSKLSLCNTFKIFQMFAKSPCETNMLNG